MADISSANISHFHYKSILKDASTVINATAGWSYLQHPRLFITEGRIN